MQDTKIWKRDRAQIFPHPQLAHPLYPHHPVTVELIKCSRIYMIQSRLRYNSRQKKLSS